MFVLIIFPLRICVVGISEGNTKHAKHIKLMMVDSKGKIAKEMTETHPSPVV